LNVQSGFESASEKWICQKCGFENDITEENVGGQCKDCRKFIPDDIDATLCDECRQIREVRRAEKLQKAQAIAVKLGKSLLATALSIVMSAAKKAVQTYVASVGSGNIFDKEVHMAAVAAAKESAILQMSDEVQGYVISKFGNIRDWLTQKIDDNIKQQIHDIGARE